MDSWYLLKPEILLKILILDWKNLQNFRNFKIFEVNDATFRTLKVPFCQNWFKHVNILFIILLIKIFFEFQ